jgi:hypothetical protein
MGEMTDATLFQVRLPGDAGRTLSLDFSDIRFTVEADHVAKALRLRFPEPFRHVAITNRTGYPDGPPWEPDQVHELGRALAHFGVRGDVSDGTEH